MTDKFLKPLREATDRIWAYADTTDLPGAGDYLKGLADREPGLAIAAYVHIAAGTDPQTYRPPERVTEQPVSEYHPTAELLLWMRQGFQNALNNLSGIFNSTSPERFSADQHKLALESLAFFLSWIEGDSHIVDLSRAGQPPKMRDAVMWKAPEGARFDDKYFVFNPDSWKCMAAAMEKLGHLDPVIALQGLPGLFSGESSLDIGRKSSDIARAVARTSDPALLAEAKRHLVAMIVDDLKTHALSNDNPDADTRLQNRITIFGAANPFVPPGCYEDAAYLKAHYRADMATSPEIEGMLVTAAATIQQLIEQHPGLEKSFSVQRLRRAISTQTENQAGNARLAKLQQPKAAAPVASAPVIGASREKIPAAAPPQRGRFFTWGRGRSGPTAPWQRP